jgi:hypothetical protein
MDIGEWKLWESVDRNVIVEIEAHVAIAYLWSKSDGILAHVWLFNIEGASGNFKTPQMPYEKIDPKRYRSPSYITDIRCKYSMLEKCWSFSWGNLDVATLYENSPVGSSLFVIEKDPLAIPI